MRSTYRRDGRSSYTLNSRSTWTARRTCEDSRIAKTCHNLDKTMRWVCTISLAMALSACSPLRFQSPLPQDGPTLHEILQQQGQATSSDRSNYPPLPPLGLDGLYGYTRTSFAELDVQFPRLPNPTIIMFVFPHLSDEQTPVPGYSTMFPLYETVHFALPGEL